MEGTKMGRPILYIDTSEIRQDKFEELKEEIKKLVLFIKENVPRLITYRFFFDESKSQMTVVAVHPDSASLEYHMNTGKEEFRKFSELLDLKKIEIYGKIRDSVCERLHNKVEMLGSGTVEVNDFFDGFSR